MGGLTWGGVRDVTRGHSTAFANEHGVSVGEVRPTVVGRALHPAPRVLRWDRDAFQGALLASLLAVFAGLTKSRHHGRSGFFHVLSRRAPDLLLNEDMRWRLLKVLALPLEEWEAEVPNSRLVGVP
jgi:hypothetical protein